MAFPLDSGPQAFEAGASSVGFAGGAPEAASHRNAPLTTRRGRDSSRTPVPPVEAANTLSSAAGRPRPNVEQLLLEQNRLLLEQVNMMREQMAQQVKDQQITCVKERHFQDPSAVLEGVDPALKCVFEEFAKQTRHLFGAWETQKALQEKYTRWIAEGKIHPHLQSEASFQ